MSEKDPFSKVYTAFWDLILANKTLVSSIRPKNMIDYTSWIGNKTEVSSADFPELQLFQDGGEYNLMYSSSHCQLIQEYKWLLATGDFKVEDYNCIKWEIIRSMVDWDTVICGITWKDAQIVKNATASRFEEGTMKSEANRGIRGWSCMWACEVEFQIPTELMRVSND